MIFSLVTTIFLTFLFSQVGQVFCKGLRINAEKYRSEITALIGLGTLATIASLFGFLGFGVRIFQILLSLFLIYRIGWIFLHLPKRSTLVQNILISNPKNMKQYILRAFPFLASFGFVSLFQSGGIDHRFAYRIGPDSFGWLDSVNFFRDDHRIAQLASSVKEQLGGTSILQSLIPTHPTNYISINQIPSFTQQIDTEFLIGAHRTGVPYLLGSIANLFPLSLAPNILIGFLGFCTFILARTAVKFSSRHSSSFSTTILATFAVVFNANLLSQTLEGGLGQYFITPFVLVLFILLLETQSELYDIFVFCIIFVLFAMTSYFEVLILILPIFALLFFSNRSRFRHSSKIRKPSLFWLVLLALSSMIPIFTSVYRLASSPFRYRGIGGWDQGRKPLPVDFFGLTPYLPHGANRLVEQRPGIVLLVEILVSIYILFLMFMKVTRASRHLLLTLCVFYLYFFISIYIKSQPPFNNYNLWKFGAYASTLFPLILICREHYAGTHLLSSPEFWNAKILKYHQHSFKLIYLCLIATTLTSIVWISDWCSSRSFTYSSVESEYLNARSIHFDFVEAGVYPALTTLYGDVHYGTSLRGDSRHSVKISSPERPVIFIMNPGSNCRNLACAEYGQNQRKQKLKITSVHNFPNFRAIETKFDN